MLGVERQIRARELAGDKRSGVWARAEARQKQRRHLRRLWRRYAFAVLLMSIVPVWLTLVIDADLVRGMVIGAAVVAIPGSLWVWTIQLTGTAPMMMGDQAEQWTASELRRLRRRGWRLVNHVSLRARDVDHVLVGPGGAYAVETKWTAGSWAPSASGDRLSAAAAQAAANARTLRLWAPFKKMGMRVHPVVVLWGGDPADEVPATLDGVRFVHGRGLTSWLNALDREEMSPGQVETAWDALDAHVRSRDSVERTEHPLPMSTGEALSSAAYATSTGIGGLLIVAEILGVTGSVGAAAALGAFTATPAVLALRLNVGRCAAWGWIAGTAGSATALIVAEILYRF